MSSIAWDHLTPILTLKFNISSEHYQSIQSSDSGSGCISMDLSSGFHLTIDNCSDIPITGFTCDSINESIVNSFNLCIRGTYSHLGTSTQDIIENVKSAHLMEIIEDQCSLTVSKSINHNDIFGPGISFAVDIEDTFSVNIQHFEIIFAYEPLQLLVSKRTLDLDVLQPQKHIFGQSLLIKFLKDTARSADMEFNSDNRSPISAHQAVIRQLPLFNSILKQVRSKNIISLLISPAVDQRALRLVINYIYLCRIEGHSNVGLIDWGEVYNVACKFEVGRLASLALAQVMKSSKK